MKLMSPVKFTIATPIQELAGFHKNITIFVKRDDLNGLLVSGNKARKMEYLVADARQKGCDTLVTCGPVQSNHCRTVAVFSQHFRFGCHLFLRGQQKKTYTGNLLIDKLLNAKITYITPQQYMKRDEIMARYADRLRAMGHRPYVIPEGGSNEVGALGYLACFKEMADYIEDNKIDAVYCAVGSGGTYAGLVLGKKLTGLSVDIMGVIVCDSVDFFTKKIMNIYSMAKQRFSLKVALQEKDITLLDGYAGEGYGIPYRAELETIRAVAKQGMILEPVYTGKAFYGMLKTMKRRGYRKVLFIHTGGIFSIFAYHQHLSSAMGSGLDLRN